MLFLSLPFGHIGLYALAQLGCSVSGAQASPPLGQGSLGVTSHIGPNVLGSAASLERRASVPFNNPLLNGGSMLTMANGTVPPGTGEPLNVIISAESDPAVLKPSLDSGSFLNYMLSTQLAAECLNIHAPNDEQYANLGDGNGNVGEYQELRWDFGDALLGTCEETFVGGLHLRYWIQASTGALFLATSVEMDLAEEHNIVPNGYNLGRDYLVGNLTGTQIDSRKVTNQTTASGSSTYGDYTYQTDVTYVSGLLMNTSIGVNHNATVPTGGYPAIDGFVAVLNVSITGRPASSGAGAVVGHFAPVAIAVTSLWAALYI